MRNVVGEMKQRMHPKIERFIALLVIFKEQLIDLLNTIFEKITSESSGI